MLGYAGAYQAANQAARSAACTQSRESRDNGAGHDKIEPGDGDRARSEKCAQGRADQTTRGAADGDAFLNLAAFLDAEMGAACLVRHDQADLVIADSDALQPFDSMLGRFAGLEYV